MDLSGVIFAALALGWAGYLIPKALRHHEEIAANRPVDSFSDTVRVLNRTPATMKALLTHVASDQPAETRRTTVPPGRSTTGSAARRRRRVLGALLVLVLGSAVAAYLGYVGWWATAVAGALVVSWLVLCRLMVRKAPVARRLPVEPVIEEAEPVEMVTATGAPVPVLDPSADDDGALWDPLPLTLPTYVSKPAARRTVRTIDLTQTGVTSSGHSVEDTALARSAEAPGALPAGAPLEAPETEQRKAAGA